MPFSDGCRCPRCGLELVVVGDVDQELEPGAARGVDEGPTGGNVAEGVTAEATEALPRLGDTHGVNPPPLPGYHSDPNHDAPKPGSPRCWR